MGTHYLPALMTETIGREQEEEALDLLTSLVNKSLVRVLEDRSGETAFSCWRPFVSTRLIAW